MNLRRFTFQGGEWHGKEAFLPETTKAIEIVSPDGLVTYYMRPKEECLQSTMDITPLGKLPHFRREKPLVLHFSHHHSLTQERTGT